MLVLAGGCRFELSGVDLDSVAADGSVDLGGVAAIGSVDLGGVAATDLASDLASPSADLAHPMLEVGAACTGFCAGGLTCYTMAGTPGNMSPLPGGFCSKACSGPSDCPASSAQCGTIEGMQLCVPDCDPSAGVNCRSEYSCCANQQIVPDIGGCGPTSSNFCGN